jgi:aspartyl-tRNA(Asn)/glutamyl-tRNA(Gln) amidotransferase subunit C
MAISRDEVRRIASLARLRFSNEEEARMAEEMSHILDYVETLNEVDTAGVPPMSHPLDLENVTREDTIEQRIDQERALAPAPDRSDGYFQVPKVVE